MTIYLIAGPPCSGKSTLARRLAEPGDPVLDLDEICRSLDGRPGWDHTPAVRARANRVMEAHLARLRYHDGDAYAIRSVPERVVRERLATSLDATVYLLDPGMRECVRRARVDNRPRRTELGVREWYAVYRPSPLDRAAPVLMVE